MSGKALKIVCFSKLWKAFKSFWVNFSLNSVSNDEFRLRFRETSESLYAPERFGKFMEAFGSFWIDFSEKNCNKLIFHKNLL
jgi:hypothetical protein